MFGWKARFAGLALGLTSLSLLVGPVGVSAQDSPANLPANIFQGTCDALGGAPLLALKQVTPNDPRVGGSFSGSKDALGVLTSESDDVRISLRTLLNSPHAIVVGDPTSPVACGEVGGFVRGIVNNDDLEIGLAPVKDSGIFGIADIEGDGNEVEIDLYVAAPYR